MLPLTVAILVRDEVDRLADAIRSVSFASEVLVLDCGSTDGSPERALMLGARVEWTDWPGFAAQRNRAQTLASHDWVLFLDADERVSPELATSIQATLEVEPEAAAFKLSRLSWWEGAPIRHGGWYPDRKLRLVRRDRGIWIGEGVHEELVVQGLIQSLKGDLHHHPYRSLSEHLQTIDRYTAAAARALYARGVVARWWDLVFRPPLHFVNAYLLRAGFLDGARGLCVAVLGSTYVLLKWSRLYFARDLR